MIEITIHGRGGQGAVTTSQLLAIAAFNDGKESQAFPSFGPERTGAPLAAFCRIDDKKIQIRSQIYQPDVSIILDETLLELPETINVKKGGIIIINTQKTAAQLNLKGNFKVYTVDATGVAMKIFSKPIVNTAILGAFAAITKIVSIDSLRKAIEELLLKKGKSLVEMNIKAVDDVYASSGILQN